MFEAYKIGIRLSLIDHVTAGLASMSRSFIKTSDDVSVLEKRILSIQNNAIKGGIMVAAGAGMLASLKGPYEEAKKLAQAKANFETLNLDASENAEAFGTAATLSHKVLGTTITENVKHIHDLHTAFGDLHHALDTSELFTKMAIVAKVANGGQDMDGLINAAAKALEHRGGKVVNDRSEFDHESNMMNQVMLGTKMRVSPKDYLTASGTGKMAYQLLDPEYLYGNFAGLMSINGGMREGTQLMTAFSSLVGGHMDNKGKGFLSELGLWEEGVSQKRLKLMQQATKGMSAEEMKNVGMLAPTTGGLSEQHVDLYTRRPDVFINTVLVPAIRRRFGMDLSDEQIAGLVAKSFNRNTGDFIGTQITMAQKLEKDSAIFRKSMGIGQAYQHYLHTPEGAEEAAGAAFRNFSAVFGTVYLPTITNGLLKLAGALDSLGQWVERNQTLVKGLVYAFAALAGVMVLGGTINLLASAFRGLGLAISILSLGQGGGLVVGLSRGLMAVGGAIAPLLTAGGLAGLASSLGVLGVKILGLIGPGSMLAAAGLVGYGAGTLIHKGIEGTAVDDAIGHGVARVLGFFGNKEAREALNINSGGRLYGEQWAKNTGHEPFNPIAPPRPNVAQVTVTNKLDRKGFSTMVAGDLAKGQQNAVGSGSLDPGVAQLPMNVRAN